MREAIGFGTEFYKITGIEFHGFKDKPPHALNELERWIWANISIYGSYDFMDPEFDMTNTQEFAPTPTSPVLDRDRARLLLDYAESDQWGRRKPPPVKPAEFDVAQHLAQRITDSQADNDTEFVALDVLGNGGGQWTLGLRQGQLCSVSIGLPTDLTIPLLQLTVKQFCQWQTGTEDPTGSIQRFLVDAPSNGKDRALSRQIAESLFAVQA
jgi:hypothetical protein